MHRLASARLRRIASARLRRLAVGNLLMAVALTDQDVLAITHYCARRLRNTGPDHAFALPIPGNAFHEGTEPPPENLLQIARASLDICNNYAGSAPYRILVEASIRCAGWLRDSDPGIAERSVVDGTDVAPRPALTGALRGSGAQAILSPYRVRRIAAVEDGG